MKKTSFSFRAVRAGSYLHRFFFGKNNNAARYKNRPRNMMAAAVLAASLGISAAADAQCNTFQNADAANPLNGLVPAGKYLSGFAFADIDADGDQDLYMFYYKDDNAHFFRNVGTPQHSVYEEDSAAGFPSVAALTLRFGTDMQFVDIDGDGDLDFFITDANIYLYTDAHVHFYKNTGNRFAPRFVDDPSENPVSFAHSSIQVPFVFADVDGDGDYDFSYVNADEYFNPPVQYSFANTGTFKTPAYKLYSYSNKNPGNNLRTYYDWNKDGKLDYFLSDPYTDSINYYRDTATGKKPGYVKDNANGPIFTNGFPKLFIDLNNDGAPEVFDFNAHYSTLAPVAVIEDTVLKNGNKTLTILSSKNHNKSYTYRWELNGKTIPKANDYYFVARVPGTYTLYVTSECGTGVSLNYEVQKTAPLLSTADNKVAGFANDISLIGIKAYPNPFVNSFTLQLPGTDCTVKITDMAGRVLLSQTTSAATLQIGGNLKAGAYIVQVWHDQELIYNATIIKQ